MQRIAGEEVRLGSPSQIIDLLAKRRSPYALLPRRVEPEKLRALLEAARWAPSSFNEQPWNFVVATRDEPEEHNRLVSVLVEANRKWAKHVPVLVLAVARILSSRGSEPNRHAVYDLGQAVANLTVQATALGLVVHQMAGFDVSRARELVGVPKGYEPMTVIALGYPGDPDSLPENLRQRQSAPRIRKPLGEFVFSGIWGEPFRAIADAKHTRRGQ